MTKQSSFMNGGSVGIARSFVRKIKIRKAITFYDRRKTRNTQVNRIIKGYMD